MTKPITVTVDSFDNKCELVVRVKLTPRFRLRLWFMMRLVELACWIGRIGLRVEDECPDDHIYVRRDLLQKLRFWTHYLSGVCADQLADSPFPDEIDGLLDETKWLVLDEGGDHDGNDSETV